MVICLQISTIHILNRWKNYFSQLLNVHRVLGIFREKGEEVTGDLRKLHNEELHNL
jgi:hypothetical protein